MADVLEIARRVFSIEAMGLTRLQSRLTDDFTKAVQLIVNLSGKVITTGIGKSGLIALKIAATFNSIGVHSVFLHPVEALHGDLGMVYRGDVALALSNSGCSHELMELTPLLKQRGVHIVALTGALNSPLAAAADLVLDCGVLQEACPLDLVPTASTTAALAMGDALAVASMELRNFAPEDFSRSHPGGNLGQRLSLQVGQVMLTGEKLPLAAQDTSVQEAIKVMDAKDLGTVVVVSPAGKLLGIFTDGDLRRLNLRSDLDWRGQTVGEFMTRNPQAVPPEMLAASALHIMEEMQITALPITGADHVVQGIIHLHDLLGRGQISFNVRAGI
jgi:arabinose-5-phosphate isomerase